MEKEKWIAKEDVGIESNMEKEKGEASDAFKRAGFNWGIGRELYTTPQIWVSLKSGEDNKGRVYTKFFVDRIEYENHSIIALEIIDQYGDTRFQWEKGMKVNQPRTQVDDQNRSRKTHFGCLKKRRLTRVEKASLGSIRRL